MSCTMMGGLMDKEELIKEAVQIYQIGESNMKFYRAVSMGLKSIKSMCETLAAFLAYRRQENDVEIDLEKVTDIVDGIMDAIGSYSDDRPVNVIEGTLISLGVAINIIGGQANIVDDVMMEYRKNVEQVLKEMQEKIEEIEKRENKKRGVEQ